ncbi:MAG: exodeoxyribonuclease VII large subunit [Alphaproteobacteria bacterium]|nr:exodeoxyribonuclease VII large subunit [Alphaproteobacteria bacterium]
MSMDFDPTAPPAPPSGPASRPGSNLPEYRVSELAGAVKRTVEQGFGHVRVRGEISAPKRHSSGHLYLRLKDETAVLDAVCWRSSAGRLSIRPEEGMEVVCTGRLTTYPARSTYQLVIEAMELAGEGALLKLLEERRKKLAGEGLFDAGRKRRLPYLPEVIGVVTSPTGAVIRDILHRLADRFPRRVLIWPVAVQGEGAAAQIAAAIEGFNALPPDGPVPRPDTLIVARGGGSLEDLMPFNEEIVVRAAAASAIPLIAAVGHETDVTLIDHAADLRAPTPTAAAELAVPVRAELEADLLDRERRRVAAMARLIGERRLRVESLGRGLGDPRRLLEGAMQRLDDRAERLDRALPVLLARKRGRLAEAAAHLRHPRQQIAEAARQLQQLSERLHAAGGRLVPRHAERLAPPAGRLAPAAERLVLAAAVRLEGAGKLLESYSYRDVVRRGFVVVRDRDGEPVTDGAGLSAGTGLRLEFRDIERVDVTVDGEKPPPRRTPPRKSGPAGQGSLF